MERDASPRAQARTHTQTNASTRMHAHTHTQTHMGSKGTCSNPPQKRTRPACQSSEERERRSVRQEVCGRFGERGETVPGRQGQRPEYQEAGSGERRLIGCCCREGGALSAQGTRVLKQPRLCLRRRAPSRSDGLLSPHTTQHPGTRTTMKDRNTNQRASWWVGGRGGGESKKTAKPIAIEEQDDGEACACACARVLTCGACCPARPSAAPGCSW